MKKLFAAITLVVPLASCCTKEEAAPVKPAPTIVGTWDWKSTHMVQNALNGGANLSDIKHEFVGFQCTYATDGSYSSNKFGIVSTGTYRLTGTTLTINAPEGTSSPATVIELTDHRLVYTYETRGQTTVEVTTITATR